MQVDECEKKNLTPFLMGGIDIEDPAELSGIIQQFPAAILITDVNGKLVSYNQPALEILGYAPPDVNLEDWPRSFGLYQADSKTYYPWKGLPLTCALRGEICPTVEIVHLDDHNQEQKWISIFATPLTTQECKIIGAIAYINDVTARKNIELSQEQLLRRSEASHNLSQQFIKIGNDPLQILKTVVHFSTDILGDGCVAALLNLPMDSLKIVSFEHRKSEAVVLMNKLVLSQEYGVEGSIAQVIISGEPLLVPAVDQARLRNLVQPDQIRYIEEIGIESFLVAPIRGRKGVIGILSLFRDRGGLPYTLEDQKYLMDIAYRAGLAIDYNSLSHSLRLETSGRRMAEEALDLSEARFRSIFASTSLGIKLLDLNGTILETNPAFQQFLGYSEDELRGNDIYRFWHPADARHLQQILEKLKADHVQSYQLNHRLLNKDGSTVWVNVTFTGIKKNEQDETLAFIVAIAENITEHKRIEAEISEMKSRLHSHIEMERLQLAQELHDGALQELYSAIYKIENWIDKADQKNKEKVEQLKQDLLKVIQELRNTAKDLRPPALANFGLEKAIRSHAEEFREQHPELAIHLNLAQDKKILPEEIRLILFRIYQHSLTNILRHAQATDVEIRFSFDAEAAQLEIADNGVGFVVPSSWVELVRQGHFGLAGAVERVGLLDGTFTVESTPGAGTMARVVIPIKENVNNSDSVIGKLAQ